MYTVAIRSSQILFGDKNVTMLRRIETVTIATQIITIHKSDKTVTITD